MKLAVIAHYLSSYTTALKHTAFRKIYIDAFAGTGYRTQHLDSEVHSTRLLFPDLAEAAPQRLLDGSARLALKTEPPFDRYVFIERSPERCTQLEGLRAEFPDLAHAIDIIAADANQEIQRLCQGDWHTNRAVLFLDPYGMQVEWKTINAVAKTEAIDLWLLFPLGIGVNRLLTRTGDIPVAWRQRLDTLLGTTAWYDEFYRVEPTPTLFNAQEERVIKASIETIGRYCNDRLKTIFAGVAEQPAVLRNSSNCPLFLLCFAAGNKKGAPIALRIANHLLQQVQ